VTVQTGYSSDSLELNSVACATIFFSASRARGGTISQRWAELYNIYLLVVRGLFNSALLCQAYGCDSDSEGLNQLVHQRGGWGTVHTLEI